MNWTLVFTDRVNRRALHFLSSSPSRTQGHRSKTLLLREANPHHPSLRLHALKGRLSGLDSVSINLSYRITLEFLIQGKKLIPMDIGDHDAFYR